jgi:4a-hydroxytetrahydrobiopterin dehydratase
MACFFQSRSLITKLKDNMMKLKDRHCIPHDEVNVLFNQEKINLFKQQLSPAWEVINESKLKAVFPTEDFNQGMEIAHEIAKLAEEEQHHPDICIHYKNVEVELSTHSIGGLTLNDFIMAAKIDEL